MHSLVGKRLNAFAGDFYRLLSLPFGNFTISRLLVSHLPFASIFSAPCFGILPLRPPYWFYRFKQFRQYLTRNHSIRPIQSAHPSFAVNTFHDKHTGRSSLEVTAIPPILVFLLYLVRRCRHVVIVTRAAAISVICES